MPMETTVPTETVTKVIEVVEQMDYTEYLVKLVNSNELILDAVHVLSGFALFAIVVVTTQMMSGVLDEILGLLPVVIPVMIGFIGLRKGISFLQSVLHSA